MLTFAIVGPKLEQQNSMNEQSLKIRIGNTEANDLTETLLASSKARMLEKGYTDVDIEYIQKLKLKLIDGGLDISEKDLEKLSLLCKLWDVELKPSQISSHRPVLGHAIVALKKLIFPIIRVMLKDSFKQQRDFNAAAVSMMAEILNRQTKENNQKAN